MTQTTQEDGKFGLSVSSEIPLLRALHAADALEKAVGEIANGRAKPGRIPMEPIAVLVQFARNVARDGLQVEDQP